MLHKRSAALILAMTLPVLAGCAQATRHSNTMVFGTNTTVGLKVGQDVNQMPQVLVAYDRQEAVIMPLLANAAERSGSGNLLSPCNPGDAANVAVSGEKYRYDIDYDDTHAGEAHPCKFVSIRKANGGLEIQDSYSVLASFGARIEGEASDTKGSVGIAQFFATGAAAQALAINGGAAIVSVGEAAEKAVENDTNAANAAAAITGAEPIAVGSGKSFDEAWGKLKIEVTQAPDAPRRLQVINQAISKAGLENDPIVPRLLRAKCGAGKTTEACQAQLDAALPVFNTREFRSN